MRNRADITNVGFKPPGDAHLFLEAMSIDELKRRAPAAHFEKVQRADFYRLIGLLDGQSNLMVDFSIHSLRAGDWLLVRPGQVFRYDFSSHWGGSYWYSARNACLRRYEARTLAT